MECLAASLILGGAFIWTGKLVKSGLERTGIETIEHMREHNPHMDISFPVSPRQQQKPDSGSGR